MTKCCLIITCCILWGSIGFSQNNIPCGSAILLSSIDADAYYAKVNALIAPRLADETFKSQATIRIPTVFHIVYQSPIENIPDSMIYAQLQIMNDDFRRLNADTSQTPVDFQSLAGRMDIEFCMATQTPTGTPTNGIVRVNTGTSVFQSPTTYAVPDPVKHTNLGGSDAWDTEHYLNIWVCNLNGSTAYSAPPGNFMPDDEGIVCKYQHVGRTHVYPYGEGRSIVHELGHYFCLKHIWGDDGGSCSGTDYINDTPNQANYSTNCPTFPKVDACSPNSPGVMFMNYMDYSEDGCRNMFTAGQCAYMLSCIQSLRPGLLAAQGCEPLVGIAQPEPSMDLRTTPDGWEIGLSEPFLLEVWNMEGRKVWESKGWQTGPLNIASSSLGSGVFVLYAQSKSGKVQRWKLAN